MVLKVYVFWDGPPSLWVLQTLDYLKVPYEAIPVDFDAKEHKTEKYGRMTPQKQVPVINDDGYFLSESVAIMQYICDKYAPGSSLYPQDPKNRATVNNRLCFGLTTYYHYIGLFNMYSLFIPGCLQTAAGLEKVHAALDVFNTYLERTGTSHVAADHLTIADFLFVNTTMLLEATHFDFSKYERVATWYANFKKNYPELWKVTEDGMKELRKITPVNENLMYKP